QSASTTKLKREAHTGNDGLIGKALPATYISALIAVIIDLETLCSFADAKWHFLTSLNCRARCMNPGSALQFDTRHQLFSAALAQGSPSDDCGPQHYYSVAFVCSDLSPKPLLRGSSFIRVQSLRKHTYRYKHNTHFLALSVPPVFMVLCFIAGTDAVIALEKDGYTSSFADFYIREGEPYLGTAYGIMISYWHAVVNFAMYLLVAEEQNKNLLQRPMDLGLVVLDCPANSCFDYIYLQEPYLRDPVAYPKIQMLVYLFYVLPYFCISIYALLVPGCTWMGDWALVFAGAIGQ
ncbi:Transmembrane 6 superfamily member 2, partial [Ophiophagus hannah]